MSIHATAQDLSLLVDRQLPVAGQEQLEQHLRQCQQCQERYLSTQQLVNELRGLERVAPPSTLGMTVRHHRQAVGQSRLRQRLERTWKRWPDPMILAYLGVVIALGSMAVAVSRMAEQSETGSTLIIAPSASDRVVTELHGVWVEPGLTDQQVVSARPASGDEVSTVLDRLDQEIPGGSKAIVARLGSEVVRIELVEADQSPSE